MPDIYVETLETNEGVTFEPTSTDGGVGYKVTAPDGRVEYVLLVPTTWHQINEENGAIADTFIYRVDETGAQAWDEENAGPGSGVSLVDLAESLSYVNHFEHKENAHA